MKIVHQDIKLENVIVSERMQFKLIDFGYSKKMKRRGDFMKSFCGTPYYMSPEIASKEIYNGKSLLERSYFQTESGNIFI